MDVEKMKRVLEAVTQQEPLVQEDWPKGREEWDWLMCRTCNVYYVNSWDGHKNKTLRKAASVMVEVFLKYVDKIYPEKESHSLDSFMEWIKDLDFIDEDEDDEPTEEELRYCDMERSKELRLKIEVFAQRCAEEYLVQMSDTELEAWKAMVKVDPNYRIQIWGGFNLDKAVTNDFVIDDTIEHLLQKRENIMKETRNVDAHWYYII